jgi:hypothetical protein
MTSAPHCPTCGQPIVLDLCPLEAMLFAILVEAYPDPIACDDVVTRLYAHRHDGGPATARQIMHKTKLDLSRHLARKGWTIKSRGGCYQLIGAKSPLANGGQIGHIRGA